MRYQANKAFDHPVLRPLSNGGEFADYPRQGFQATVSDPVIDRSSQVIRLSVAFDCHQPDVVETVSRGEAEYAVVVHCRHTLFRKLYRSVVNELKFEIGCRDVIGTVDIMPCVFATGAIDGFNPKGQHSEFGGGTYVIEAGAPLAIDLPKNFNTDLDRLKNITSVFRWVPDPTKQSGEFDVSIENTVRVHVNPRDKVKLERAATTGTGQGALANDIFVPIVMALLQEAVRLFEDGCDDPWYESILLNLDELDKKHTDTQFNLESVGSGRPTLWWTAQAILGFPGRELGILREDG